MNILFLEAADLASGDFSFGDASNLASQSSANPLGSMMGGVLLGILMGVIFFAFAIYIYLSLAYSGIGRKAKLTNPNVAWIPFTGPLSVIFEAAQASWWPFLVSSIGFILGYAILIYSSMSINLGMIMAGGAILLITGIFLGVMGTIWQWKTYEAIGKPGWWALIPMIGMGLSVLLSFLGTIAALIGVIISILGMLIHLILIGVAAWSQQ